MEIKEDIDEEEEELDVKIDGMESQEDDSEEDAELENFDIDGIIDIPGLDGIDDQLVDGLDELDEEDEGR